MYVRNNWSKFGYNRVSRSRDIAYINFETLSHETGFQTRVSEKKLMYAISPERLM